MSMQVEDPRVIEFDVHTDEMLINMGPQHPWTHGVLRLLLRTDGEVVNEVTPHIGYLHRCAEKIGENLNPVQWIPYTDRMDYLAAMNMNLGMALAVEKLIKMEVPEKAVTLRVIIAELNRIASHLVGMGAYGLDLELSARSSTPSASGRSFWISSRKPAGQAHLQLSHHRRSDARLAGADHHSAGIGRADRRISQEATALDRGGFDLSGLARKASRGIPRPIDP